MAAARKGDVAEALSGISEPAALFFSVAGEEMLEHAATEIEKRFPGVACIGGVGQAYIDKQFFDQGITVTAMRGEIKSRGRCARAGVSHAHQIYQAP